MISHLRIKNFAIIEELEVSFHPGLNMITGETGAGKSIIIEAVSLALGSRADTAFIRTGKDKATIQMVADIGDEEYIITREIAASGKNLCRINGEIVPLAQLNKLCKKIADIHGQYDHQSLLNPENHISFVDLYESHLIAPTKADVAALYQQYTETKKELAALLANEAEMERKRDFMQFEIQEISAADPRLGEDEELTQQLIFLQNSEKIYQNLSSLYELLGEDVTSVIDGLSKGQHLLQEIAHYAEEIKSFEGTLSEAYYSLSDLSTEIRRYRDSISFSPEDLEETMQRLQTLDTLKRKYGGTLEKVLAYREQTAQAYEKVENLEQFKETLTEAAAQNERKLRKASEKLTKLRKTAALAMEKRINDELKELHFKHTTLSIHFEEATGQHEMAFRADGVDRIEFLISTNLGEAPKPLVKVASGGEISRIMLAFKQIIGDYDHIPTMIFDEIDSGISGITASIVGKKLMDISQGHQIMCISHLPQIAAFGDHHYKIQKEIVAGVTQTQIIPLSEEQKVEEIARLLGGINITETTIKSARELISLSNQQGPLNV